MDVGFAFYHFAGFGVGVAFDARQMGFGVKAVFFILKSREGKFLEVLGDGLQGITADFVFLEGEGDV